MYRYIRIDNNENHNNDINFERRRHVSEGEGSPAGRSGYFACLGKVGAFNGILNICIYIYIYIFWATHIYHAVKISRAGVVLTADERSSYCIVGRLSYVFVWVSCFFARSSRMSPECHRNSPKSCQNFARISNGSTLKRRITTTRPSHMLHV